MPRTQIVTDPPVRRQESQEQYLARCLQPLTGCTLTAVALDAAGNVALVLEDDTHHVHYLSITRDPEGNGPGWIDWDPDLESAAYAAYLAILPRHDAHAPRRLP